MNVEINREQFEDCWEEFNALNREHWAEFNTVEPSLSKPFLSHCELFTARVDGLMVGYVVGFACEDPYYAPKTLFVVDMYYVTPSQRKHGIGTKLIEAIMNYADVLGASAVMASYNLRQSKETFYRKLGFLPTHVVMRKEI